MMYGTALLDAPEHSTEMDFALMLGVELVGVLIGVLESEDEASVELFGIVRLYGI